MTVRGTEAGQQQGTDEARRAAEAAAQRAREAEARARQTATAQQLGTAVGAPGVRTSAAALTANAGTSALETPPNRAVALTAEAPPSGRPRPITGPGAAPSAAATQAVERVTQARQRYDTARQEVDRLNGHLERALRTEPSLRDPAAAERFRQQYQTTHQAAYDAERTGARELADSIRAAEPAIRADGNTLLNANQRIQIAQGLTTLAQSSEYRQAPQLAQQYGSGEPPPLNRDITNAIGERAALTGLREDLAAGKTPAEAVRNASTLLSVAGMASRLPALSAIGSTLGAGADYSEFLRTGDPASLNAARFGAVGAVAAGVALFAGGPISVGAGLVAGGAAAGKFFFRQQAENNAYRGAVTDALAQTHGVTPDQARQLMSSDARSLQEGGLNNADLIALARSGRMADAARTYLGGYNERTGSYGDNLDARAVDERVRRLEREQPGLPGQTYFQRAITQLREERRAQHGTPQAQLRADLVRQGLLSP